MAQFNTNSIGTQHGQKIAYSCNPQNIVVLNDLLDSQMYMYGDYEFWTWTNLILQIACVLCDLG